MFNLFGKKDKDAGDQVFVDRAYMTTSAKMQACADSAKKDQDLVFISWFAETSNRFRDFFKQQGIDDSRIMDAHHMHAARLVNKTPVFVEHYPLHTKELDLIKNWEAKNIIVYSAMDEPLFKHFGSEKLLPIMKMLGMKESEVIEHQMVCKSIIKGQEKIAEQVEIEQSATSQEEWMRKNLG